MVTRRIFLRNALVVSAATWVAALGIGGLSRKLRVWFFPRRLPAPVLAFLADLDQGADVGRIINLRRPQRRDLVTRTEAFLTESVATDRPLAPAVQGRIADDFRTGRVVVADGWYLAETEAAIFLVQADIRRGLYRAS